MGHAPGAAAVELATALLRYGERETFAPSKLSEESAVELLSDQAASLPPDDGNSNDPPRPLLASAVRAVRPG